MERTWQKLSAVFPAVSSRGQGLIARHSLPATRKQFSNFHQVKLLLMQTPVK